MEESAIRRALMRWYRAHGRHGLPWRLTRDPYAVLVSEVMLQQTQVRRVIPYYQTWLERWPTIESLAAATLAEVIRAWSGLGYNRRGLALHRLAVEATRIGGLPPDTAGLRALPGIGPYTANAIQSFARERRTAVVETNIARVLARVFSGLAAARDTTPALLNARAEAFLPSRNTREHNLALMDLGATICTSRAPLCGACPIAASCAWRSSGTPASLTTAKPTPRFETTARFARGRIIDALRERPASSEALAGILPPAHHAELEGYLAALEREGLVVTLGDGPWGLPGALTGG